MKNKIITRTVAILLCSLCLTTVNAQFADPIKIASPNRESRAEYGTSVAINENFAVVGAARETIASGAAYIYKKDAGGNWIYSQRLAADDPNEGAEYGGGAKITDDYLVIAAGRANVGPIVRAGALYVYELQNDQWEFSTKLVASDLSEDAKIGMNPTSLDAEANTIVAGAPGENFWTGSVYVFTKEGGTWSETQKILSPNPQMNTSFGIGVSISGDNLLIGANEDLGTKGAVYSYYKNSDGIWEFYQTILASDGANMDYFGTSISMKDNQMVVGAYGVSDEAGAAYIFEKDSQGNWNEVQRLVSNSSLPNTQFGWSSDIQRDYISISAPRIYGEDPGEVYFYKRNNSGQWVESQILVGSTSEVEDVFGWSVAMHGADLIAGAPWSDLDETGNNEMNSAGAAYLFNNPDLLGGLPDYTPANQIRLYPNPTQNKLTIESPNQSLVGLKIYGVTGALLMETTDFHTNLFSLDISNYPQGLYFVHLTLTDGKTRTYKIIKN